MNIRDLRGKTVLVTGAGSGIGKETALAFARRGADLIVCDVDGGSLRQSEQLIRDLGRQVRSHTVDVSSREQMRAFADAVHRDVPAVDILMNNAGVGLGGGLLDIELDDWEWVVGINLWGVIYGCHFFVPAMVKRGQGGHVVNVSSAAGYAATDTLVAYCTTKFGVLGLSEAIRQELAPHRIGVTAICPGLINTAITRTSRIRGIGGGEAARERMIAIYQRRNYGPERVAANVLRAVERNRAVAPITAEAWALYLLKRFTPGALAWVNRRMSGRLRGELSGDVKG